MNEYLHWIMEKQFHKKKQHPQNPWKYWQSTNNWYDSTSISIKMFSSDDNRVIRDVMFTFIIDFITFPSMSTCEFTCDTCTVFFTSL